MGKWYDTRSRIARDVLITQLPEALRREQSTRSGLRIRRWVCRMAVCLEVGFLEEKEP